MDGLDWTGLDWRVARFGYHCEDLKFINFLSGAEAVLETLVVEDTQMTGQKHCYYAIRGHVIVLI